MATLAPHFAHYASIIPVINIDESLRFYRDTLDFRVTFQWNEPVDYVVLKMNDQISIHLALSEKNMASDCFTRLYFFVNDIHKLYETLILRGAHIHTPINRRDYGMIDFDLKDPDGHIISFGNNT